MHINSTHHLKGTYLIGASGVALTLLAGALLFPSLPDGASAADPSASTAIRTNVNVAPILSLFVGDPPTDTATVKVTPTENGTFSSKTLPVTVSTNNETGYSLYLSIADGKTDNKLKPSAATNSSVINPVTDPVISTRFAANTWGYNLGTTAPDTNTTYSAVPLDRTTPQKSTTAPTTGDGDSYNLTFGTKVNTNLPADTYSTQVVLSAVTNPAYVPTLSALSNMQDITPEICAKSAENETARLMDKRDNKLYWVTKLKDGNCWMTQNLDYDIPASGLTSDDSDINNTSGVWSSSSTYAPQATSTDINVMKNTSHTGTYSWDPGMYVKTTPTDWNKYCNNVSGYDDPACAEAGWTDVSSMTAMTEERTDGVVTNGNTYDAHYLVGNFYQWNAATAGSGGTITSGEINDIPADLETNLVSAEDSICPKGWELPKVWGNTSFINLLSQYSSDDTSNIFTGLTTETMSGTINDGKIATAPLYLQYSGNPGTGGTLGYAGNGGYFWSSTAYPGPSLAFDPYFYQSGVYAYFGVDRYNGFSVRCLAPSA